MNSSISVRQMENPFVKRTTELGPGDVITPAVSGGSNSSLSSDVGECNISAGSSEECRDGDDVRPVLWTVVIATIIGVIVVVTIFGNLLVCLTVVTDRKMRNTTNYFILSLAIADLLLGCVVLPFSAINTLNIRWPLGSVFCNVYISTDVTLCTVSILTLFAISLDRYFAITTPFRYEGYMSSTVVWKVSAGIWSFSVAMAFLPIHFGWNTESGKIQNSGQTDVCVFSLNKIYAILISLFTYFTPLIVMSAVYIRVLQITRKQVKEINKLFQPSGTAIIKTCIPEAQVPPPNPADRRTRQRPASFQHEHKMVSDRKATINLASIVVAFALCWIPYFVVFTVKPFIDIDWGSGLPYHIDLLTLWLGYVNSTVNPFLYAFYNSAFRRGFRKLLCGWRENSALSRKLSAKCIMGSRIMERLASPECSRSPNSKITTL